MFCSVKTRINKSDKVYRFYLSNRYRDKITGKVKSSDTFIISLHENVMKRTDDKSIISQIVSLCSDKNIDDKDTTLIINKFKNIKK